MKHYFKNVEMQLCPLVSWQHAVRQVQGSKLSRVGIWGLIGGTQAVQYTARWISWLLQRRTPPILKKKCNYAKVSSLKPFLYHRFYMKSSPFQRLSSFSKASTLFQAYLDENTKICNLLNATLDNISNTKLCLKKEGD